jgi:hypothetical protein
VAVKQLEKAQQLWAAATGDKGEASLLVAWEYKSLQGAAKDRALCVRPGVQAMENADVH